MPEATLIGSGTNPPIAATAPSLALDAVHRVRAQFCLIVAPAGVTQSERMGTDHVRYHARRPVQMQ